jgi:hypothetical protein
MPSAAVGVAVAGEYGADDLGALAGGSYMAGDINTDAEQQLGELDSMTAVAHGR